MRSHNQFSIDLARQKSKAKQRLKSIRQGDVDTLRLVKGFHSQAATLNPDTIQLADVQLALARELGLASWAKLKAHTQELAFHKRAINNKQPVLDEEVSTLHVRCGHDIQQQLKTCGFKGEFLPLIDPLCIGPIPSNEKEFIDIRAQYVADTLLPIMGREDTAQDIAASERNSFKTLLDEKYQRLVFWLEHDAYDQLMLLRALTVLGNKANKINKTIEIVELNDFPGAEKFIGLGQLPSEAIRSCWQHRRAVDAALLNQAKLGWKALLSGQPHTIVAMLNKPLMDRLPNLANVFKRLLQELPHSQTGLSLTQRIALNVLKAQHGSIPFAEWFRQYQQREPLPFLGDVMFYALLLPLTMGEAPLLVVNEPDHKWHEQTFSITSFGLECLDGKCRIAQQYWVGSIHINKTCQWCWDHHNLASLKQDDL